MSNLVYLIPLLPFLGFLINGLGRKFLSKGLIGIIGSGTVLAAFIISLLLFINKSYSATPIHYFDFINVGSLKIPFAFQQPFEPTHEAMAALTLRRDLPAHKLAANLRRAFSGIVAGNVKEQGLRAIETYGVYELHGDTQLMHLLDDLLNAFVTQKRMKLQGEYQPCYRVVK